MKTKNKIMNTLYYAILILMSASIIIPLIWIVGNSFKSDMNIRQDMASILPAAGEWEFSNYVKAWNTGRIGQTVTNSIVITVVSVFLILVISYFAAYAIARIKFKGCEVIYTVLAALMLVPLGQVTMIPQFRIISALGLLDKKAGVILLFVANGVPFSVFLLTSFLRKLPIELDEAAKIDGCNRLQVMGKILLPLSRPGLATVIIFQGMAVWNDYFISLIYLRSPESRTVALGLKNFSDSWGVTQYNQLFAAVVMIAAPVVLLYVIFQKQFIGGLTSGSVKG